MRHVMRGGDECNSGDLGVLARCDHLSAVEWLHGVDQLGTQRQGGASIAFLRTLTVTARNAAS